VGIYTMGHNGRQLTEVGDYEAQNSI